MSIEIRILIWVLGTFHMVFCILAIGVLENIRKEIKTLHTEDFEND